MAYQIYKKRAWKRNKSWPDGFEPCSGARKAVVMYTDDIAEARRICKEHNDQRRYKDDPFCEFTSDY